MTDLSGIQHALGDAATRLGRELIDRVLAELAGAGLNQHTRLLRLHTPLGPDVLLAERAEVAEQISPHGTDWLGFRIELLALSTQAHLAPADLMGQPVLLELLTAHSRTALRPFHGHVTAFELLGSDGGLARYRLIIEPWAAFMRHRTDSWAFQDLSVQGVIDQVVNDYAGQGHLAPKVRWELNDPAAYATLSLYTQHAETDLAFVQRALSTHGLFCWFEHHGDVQDRSTLGSHTLVIADHPGALRPNAQDVVRFTQAATVLKEDSLTRWQGRRRLAPSALHHASWDYRAVASHSGQARPDAAHGQDIALHHVDQPGAYAFETPAHAQQAAQAQQQAHEAQRKVFEGFATVRTLAPATTFALHDHAEHDADRLHDGDDSARFVVLGVCHQARNNLRADTQAGLQHLLGPALLRGHTQAWPNATDEPLYQARFTAQRALIAVRPAIAQLHPKPTVEGVQTALVVGLAGPVHTDRDGRIKVQFHWQRGSRSSHRLPHTTPTQDADNAPASDASGTWVRVAQPAAGANWGAAFIPRLGQEVLVAFTEGDIDRPLVIGAAYNAQGHDNAQGNVVAGGSAGATGNAPAWFPGSAPHGPHEGHAHTATLSGFKSQSLDASQHGGGGHNQLVFDDTPGQGRVLAHTTQRQTWLQMGHLLQQADNLRLARRGHGLELHTQAQGALRAGSGLHLSTHERRGGTSTSQGQPTHTREAQQQLQAHAGLLKALADNAQTHRAQLPGEPAPAQLGAHVALQATLGSLQGSASSAGAGTTAADEGAFVAIDGGHGRIPVTERPDLVLSSAADIHSATPAHTVLSTGQHATVTAGQDTNLLSQRHSAWAVKDGISLFTRGEAKDRQRAVQDVGLKLHAASGNVNTQAQSDRFLLTAEQAIDVQSTAASIVISAPHKIVLNGSGGYVKIEGGDIEIGTGGLARFKGAMKELAGGASASAAVPSLARAAALNVAHHLQYQAIGKDGQPLAHRSYVVIKADGSTQSGKTDADGRTKRITTERREQVQIYIDDADHHGFRLITNG